MKKIFFLLLITVASYGQTLTNPTFGTVKIKTNVTDNGATKVGVQSVDGSINTIPKSDLIEVIEISTASAMPVTGVSGKIYVTLDNNRLYRWTGTIYQELTIDVSGKENISNKQNSLVADGTGNKYLTVDAVNSVIGYVTPEQFGAIGDGITNDAIAIQNAVNSGKSVLFGAKTYLTNSTIAIGLQTELRGYGNSSIIKTTSNLPVFDLQSSGVKINDLQILGSGRVSVVDYTTTFPLQDGIKISGFYFDINISKVYFNNLGNAGIYGLDNTVTSSSDIKNGVNVNNCKFRNNLIGVFWDTEFEFNVITNSYFRANEWGIRLKGGNNAIHGGQVIRNRKGITLEAGLNDAHSVASGVHINQNLDFGIHADGIINGHIFANCVIMFNPIYVNNSIGITFDGGEYKLQTTGFAISNSTNTTVQNINFLATPSLTESGNTRLKFFNNTFVATRPANMAETLDNLEIVNANSGIPLKINTGASVVTNDIVNMPFGSVRFGNSGVSTAFPTLTGKSNNNGGLFLIGATNNTNAFPDMGFDVRENDNTDFADLTKVAFQFSRFTSNPLLTILRNGQSTFSSRVIATGTGNDYNTGAFQVTGNGASNTIFPTLGFNQPTLYGGSLQFKIDNAFHFYGFNNSAYAPINASIINGTSGNFSSTVTATNHIGAGTGLTGTATALSIGGNSATVGGQAFNYSNISNTPTYLWASDVNGANFLMARNALAYVASPALTGTPTAPTATIGNNTTQIATTAFVLANSGATSGTYVPTISSLANISSVTVGNAKYIKVGNVIYVNVSLSGGITAISTNTSYNISLPFNKTATNTSHNIGQTDVVVSGIHTSGNVNYISSASTVKVSFNSETLIGTSSHNVSFMYDITE